MNHLSKSVKRFAGVAALMFGFAAASAVSPLGAPANAQPPACGIATICTWSGPNYTGARRDFTVNAQAYCGPTVISVRSVVNNVGPIDFWSGNCSGSLRTVWGLSSNPDLGFDAQTVGWCWFCE